MINYFLKNLSLSNFFIGGTNYEFFIKISSVPYLFCNRNNFFLIDVLLYLSNLKKFLFFLQYSFQKNMKSVLFFENGFSKNIFSKKIIMFFDLLKTTNKLYLKNNYFKTALRQKYFNNNIFINMFINFYFKKNKNYNFYFRIFLLNKLKFFRFFKKKKFGINSRFLVKKNKYRFDHLFFINIFLKKKYFNKRKKPFSLINQYNYENLYFSNLSIIQYKYFYNNLVKIFKKNDILLFLYNYFFYYNLIDYRFFIKLNNRIFQRFNLFFNKFLFNFFYLKFKFLKGSRLNKRFFFLKNTFKKLSSLSLKLFSKICNKKKINNNILLFFRSFNFNIYRNFLENDFFLKNHISYLFNKYSFKKLFYWNNPWLIGSLSNFYGLKLTYSSFNESFSSLKKIPDFNIYVYLKDSQFFFKEVKKLNLLLCSFNSIYDDFNFLNYYVPTNSNDKDLFFFYFNLILESYIRSFILDVNGYFKF